MDKKIVMTAVQQLIHDMRNIDMSIFNDEHCKKYLEMEKQQILDAFTKGADDGFNGLSYENREQYYNETYGSKGSDEKKEYPHSHIYETMNGRYGLSSYNEHDQTDGIFDTYQEAVDFGLSQLKNK